MNHGRSDGRQRVVVAEFNFLDISQVWLGLIKMQKPRTAMNMERTLTEMVSFSFTIGTTPMDKSSLKVLTALRYLVR